MTDLGAAFGVAFAPQWTEETDPINLDKRFLGLDTAEVISERETLDLDYLKFSESAIGRRIVDDLKQRVLYRDGFNPQLGLLNGIAAGFEKVGQENFLKYILNSAQRGAQHRAKIARETNS